MTLPTYRVRELLALERPRERSRIPGRNLGAFVSCFGREGKARSVSTRAICRRYQRQDPGAELGQ